MNQIKAAELIFSIEGLADEVDLELGFYPALDKNTDKHFVLTNQDFEDVFSSSNLKGVQSFLLGYQKAKENIKK